MNITMTQSRRWNFNILRDEHDADWPDERPKPYSRTGQTYRPMRLSFSFRMLDDGAVKLDGSVILGPRIVKAGPVGAIQDERLYGGKVNEPWFTRAVEQCLTAIERTLR